jgi:hypothetical protein
VNKKSNDLLLFWERPNYIENWEIIYDNPKVIPTQPKGILILNGYDIFNNNVLNVED